MIVFILGRTGSGKSTTACFLTEIAQSLGWSVQNFNDYPILRKMYELDTLQRFRPTDHDGFEVLDLTVYEIAIRSLAQQVQRYKVVNDRTFITIEFTSNNYHDALHLFDDTLLHDAYFFFLNVDLKTCLERTHKRVFHQITKNDYYVIGTVLLLHYPSPYMPHHIGKKIVKFIDNMGSIDELKDKLHMMAPILLGQGEQKPVSMGKPALPFAKQHPSF